MAVVHPEKLVMAIPNNRLDQIVDILTGTTTVAAATVSGGVITVATSTATLTPLSPDYYYVKGIWSYDGGLSWQELGNSPIVATDAQNGSITLSLNVNSTTSRDGTPNKLLVNVSNYNYNTNYTILYKVIVMARKDQGLIGVKALAQALRYSSKNKYMKVTQEGIVALPTSGTITIAHNLGYIPNFNAWYLFDDIAYGATDSYMQAAFDTSGIDTTNLYISAHSSAGSFDLSAYYRIYLNA